MAHRQPVNNVELLCDDSWINVQTSVRISSIGLFVIRVVIYFLPIHEILFIFKQFMPV